MGSRVPAYVMIFSGIEGLHVLTAEFEVKHVGILLDPFVGHRFGQRNKTLFQEVSRQSSFLTVRRASE